MLYLPFAFLGVVALGSVVWLERRRRDAVDAWRTVADEHQLRFDEGGWYDGYALVGHYDGVEVEVESDARYSSFSFHDKRTHTVFRGELPAAVPGDLTMYVSGFGSSVPLSVGGPSVEVGVPEVDDAWTVESFEPGRVRSFLSREAVVDCVEWIRATERDVWISGGNLEFDIGRLPRRAERLESHLDFLADVHRRLCEAA